MYFLESSLLVQVQTWPKPKPYLMMLRTNLAPLTIVNRTPLLSGASVFEGLIRLFYCLLSK